jgi:hypothetical protein
MVSQGIAGYLRISQSFASLEYQERVKDFKKQSQSPERDEGRLPRDEQVR